MSVTNFYQTLYQDDPIFRVAGESWVAVAANPKAAESEVVEVVNVAPVIVIREPALPVAPEPVLVIAPPEPEPIVIPVPSEPEPVRLVVAPEPLPKPAPRPTVPSSVPPAQQISRPTPVNHKVLLLADEELDPSNLLFLEKILRAVNLNIDGVDLLNLHGVKDVDFEALVQDKKIHHFITFGVPFSRIHLDIAMDRYLPVRFFGITFLMADSLPTIEADQLLKKRLWGALKQIFLGEM